ncbi:MAG: hypothetical protein IJA01_05700 [Firmicutes bacterium]|nr:hypothetical protein [Bacillota bacterium]
MEKKKIIGLLLVFILAFSICSCGSNGGTTNITGYNEEEMTEAMGIPEVVRCCKYLEEHNAPYYGFWEFLESLKANAPNNIFTKELTAQHDALTLGERTDFEKDFFEIFPSIISANWGSYEIAEQGCYIDKEHFGSAWLIGYDGKETSNVLPHDARAIILESTGIKEFDEDEKVYVYLIAFDGRYSTSYIYGERKLKDITGINLDSDEGTCRNLASSVLSPASDTAKKKKEIEAAYTGVPYVKLQEKEVHILINEFYSFNDIFKTFVDNEYYDYDPYDDSFNERADRIAEQAEKQQIIEDKIASGKTPVLGMTIEEVEKSAWGAPNYRNVTEYSWGTTEYWVYNNYGYVYFVNGIVEVVSHRE